MSIGIRTIAAGVVGCLAVLLLAVTPVHAQPVCVAGNGAGICLPNEFAVGIGTLTDRVPRESPFVVMLGLSFISNTWPLDIVLEGDLGPTTREAPECHVKQDTPNCFDASFMVGPRFRLVRGSPTRHVLPFINTFLGPYWRGSGATLGSAASAHFAVQLGGGFDIQWSESIQGIRIGGDYRRVVAYGPGSPGLNQVRFMVAYVLNERAVTP